MIERIGNLYFELEYIGMVYNKTQKIGNIDAVKEYMPEITEFIKWFLSGNSFGIDNETYELLTNNLVEIMNDIITAIENNDRVLLNDAIQFGLQEYLRMFIDMGD